MTNIKAISAHHTDTVDLGPHLAKPTAITEGQTEASIDVWVDERITTGLWECTTGSFTGIRDGYTEICTILSGRVTVESEGMKSEEYGPGDILVMPSGWAGTWHVHEPVRKHFTTIKDDTDDKRP